MELWFSMEKLWGYGKKYGTITRTINNRTLKIKTQCRLPKTNLKKLSFIMEKPEVIYQKN